MRWHWIDDPETDAHDAHHRCVVAPGRRHVVCAGHRFAVTTREGLVCFDATGLPHPEPLSVLHVEHIGPSWAGDVARRSWRSEAFDHRQRWGPAALAVAEAVLCRALAELALGGTADQGWGVEAGRSRAGARGARATSPSDGSWRP